MSRKINEWIGDTDDSAIPPRVKIRVFIRDGKKCCICTFPIVGKLRPAYDHTIAIINGGENREKNLQLLCVPCHAEKTGNDVAIKSKTARIQKKHFGLKKPRTITRWRRFDRTIRDAGRER
jgi:5-methylcytosine-specific restriction protein A